MDETETLFLHRLRRDGPTYLWAMMPSPAATGLCIVTTGRTGSSLLVDLLDSQPSIRCDGEIFAAYRDNPVLFIKGRARRVRRQGCSVYGFKLNTLFLSARFLSASPKRGPVDLIRRLSERGFAFIHLRRRNLLRQAISTLRGEQLGFAFVEGSQRPDRKVDLDVPLVISAMSTYEQHDSHLTELLAPTAHRTVWYEDDLQQPDDQTRTLENLCGWLKLAPSPATTTLQKIGRTSIADDVENYDEIVRALRPTRFAHHLDA